jgi:hypothetical protein
VLACTRGRGPVSRARRTKVACRGVVVPGCALRGGGRGNTGIAFILLRAAGRVIASATFRVRGRGGSALSRVAESSHAGVGQSRGRGCPVATVRAVPAKLLLSCLLPSGSRLAPERISRSADQAAGDGESAASPRRTGSRDRGGRRGSWRSRGAVSDSPITSIASAAGGCPGSRRTLSGGPPASSAPVGSVRGD